MRIAIYHNLPSGGAKRTLYEAAKRLSQRHTLDEYTLDTADRDYCNLNEFTNTEYVYHFSPSKLFQSPFGRINQLQRWRDLQRLNRLSREISRKIDTGKYDVVFVQPCMWTQAPLVLRYLNTPAVYYCHEPPRHLYEKPFRKTISKSRFLHKVDTVDPLLWLYQKTGKHFDLKATRSANVVLVNSIFIRDRVKEIYGINPVISYHGVDTDVFSPGLKRKGNYILSVGAIQPHKGYDFLIRSFSHIDQKIRPTLRLIGNMQNTGEHEFLQQLAKQRGVSLRIEVGVDQAKLVQSYNKALLVAYAPYNEPFGLVPLEAMACAVPVVGVCEGGIRETVVHEFTGLLAVRNEEHFGAAIQNLLQNPGLTEAYGQNGREHVLKNWSWEKSVSTLLSHLENCANGQPLL